MTDSTNQIKVRMTAPIESKPAASLNWPDPHGHHHSHMTDDTLLIVLCACGTLLLIAMIVGFILLRWQKARITGEKKLKQTEFDNQFKLETFYHEQRTTPSPFERSIKEHEKLSAIIDKFWAKDEKIRKETGEEKSPAVKEYIASSLELLVEQSIKTIEEMKAP
jgi:hypothetical protein